MDVSGGCFQFCPDGDAVVEGVDEVFGQVGGVGSELAEGGLFVGVEEPVAGEFGEIFAGTEAGVEADDADSARGFASEAVLHVVGVDLGVFGGEVGEFVDGGAGAWVGDDDCFYGVVGQPGGTVAVGGKF